MNISNSLSLLSYKFLFFIFFSIQYFLWVGDGGWRDVWKKESQLSMLEMQLEIDKKKLKQIRAQVDDLQKGYNFLEEKARFEMGMIKPDEKFLQLRNKNILEELKAK